MTPSERIEELGKSAALAVNANDFKGFSRYHTEYRRAKQDLRRPEDKQLAIQAWQTAYRSHRKVLRKTI